MRRAITIMVRSTPRRAAASTAAQATTSTRQNSSNSSNARGPRKSATASQYNTAKTNVKHKLTEEPQTGEKASSGLPSRGRTASKVKEEDEDEDDLSENESQRTKVKEEEDGVETASGRRRATAKPASTGKSKRPAPSTGNATRQGKRVKSEADALGAKESGLLSPSPSPKDEEDDYSLSDESESTSSEDYEHDGEFNTNSKQKSKLAKKTSSKSMSASKSSSKSSSEAKTKTKIKSETTPTKDLSSKKLEAYFKNANKSPFPDFAHPTVEESKLAHRILASLHGERTRPETIVASKDRAGCGDSRSVLDALVRTILSQNTSDKNSTRAKKSMDAVYGGSDEWALIMHGGQAKLQEAIKCGGLSAVKSKVILSILQQVHDKYGKYSLDHLHERSNDEAMHEMLSFQGVGPKTASCVLLFCLRRESFAVDTHVHRITGLLGWRPRSASRDETHAHLDAKIPDEDKYGLHILLVKHGKVCDECKAGGKNVGKCELRRAFRREKIKGEVGEDVKGEESDMVKKEEGEEESD